MAYKDIFKNSKKDANKISDEQRHFYAKKGWLRYHWNKPSALQPKESFLQIWGERLFVGGILGWLIYGLFQIPLKIYIEFFIFLALLVIWLVWIVYQSSGGSDSDFGR